MNHRHYPRWDFDMEIKMAIGLGRVSEKYQVEEGAACTQREPEVPAALQEVESRISELQDEVRMLIERIRPAMRGESPVPDGPKNSCIIQSELASVISQQSIRIEQISDDVRNARNRLEL